MSDLLERLPAAERAALELLLRALSGGARDDFDLVVAAARGVQRAQERRLRPTDSKERAALMRWLGALRAPGRLGPPPAPFSEIDVSAARRALARSRGVAAAAAVLSVRVGVDFDRAEALERFKRAQRETSRRPRSHSRK